MGLILRFIKQQFLQYISDSLRDVSLFSGGGGRGEEPLFWGEGHNFFPSCLGEGHNIFKDF